MKWMCSLLRNTSFTLRVRPQAEGRALHFAHPLLIGFNKWFLFCGIYEKQKSVIQNRELIASASSLRLCVKNLLKGGGS